MKRAIRKFKETVEIRSSRVNRVRSHRYFPAAVLVTACLVAACVHVWQRVKVIELVKEVSRLETENTDLLDHLKKVRSDIASLTTSTRIEQYACDTLGLQPVAADRVYTLNQERPPAAPPDRLASLSAALRRIAACMPVVTQATAHADELRILQTDSLHLEERAR